MAILDTIHRVQPQDAQLSVRFYAPLTEDMQVEKVSDLLDLKFNYLHKLVWVREEVCHYYLYDGDGTLASNWKVNRGVTSIELYDQNREYNIGELCYINGVIYSAKSHIPVDTNPEDYPNLWEVVTGDIKSYRYVFDDTETTTFTTNVLNPIIEIYTGLLTKDSNDEYVKDINGFIKITDGEFIDAEVENVSAETDTFTTLIVSFFENGLPVKLSGIINVK